MTTQNRPIKVLVVDDSLIARRLIRDALTRDPSIEVVGGAPDPYVAREKIIQQEPDALTLDIQMPRMDGLVFLQKLMRARPMPVVVVSSFTDATSRTTLKALEYGAVGALLKPDGSDPRNLDDFSARLCHLLRTAVRSSLHMKSPARGATSPAHSTSVLSENLAMGARRQLVAIGASTGGTEALKSVLEPLPRNCPGIVVVQHMPEHFTAAFAQRLNQSSQMEVLEAEDMMPVKTGRAIIANGAYHMVLKQDKDGGFVVRLKDGPLVNGHRPSVDVLFQSVAALTARRAVGVIMTGMGADGAEGLKSMRDQGAATIAQDEASCVVFGMPKAAIEREAVDKVAPLDRIPITLLQALKA